MASVDPQKLSSTQHASLASLATSVGTNQFAPALNAVASEFAGTKTGTIATDSHNALTGKGANATSTTALLAAKSDSHATALRETATQAEQRNVSSPTVSARIADAINASPTQRPAALSAVYSALAISDPQGGWEAKNMALGGGGAQISLPPQAAEAMPTFARTGDASALPAVGAAWADVATQRPDIAPIATAISGLYRQFPTLSLPTTPQTADALAAVHAAERGLANGTMDATTAYGHISRARGILSAATRKKPHGCLQ
ncbi:MAG: hypothetical protein ACYDA1_00625 [Vulcanimicrobiaceae bacterium]